jgi:hypothetical protein
MPARTIWSEEELKILKENYPTKSRQELLSLLPYKRWTSIRHKAGELHLKKEYLGIWSPIELETLRREWPIKEQTRITESIA